jgi:AraC-like DNA-binding protein
MRTVPPCAALAPLVQCFELVESDVPATRVLLPEPGLILGFRYQGWSAVLDGKGESARTRLPDHLVTGLRVTVRHMHTAAGSAVVLAKLRDGGAVPFLSGPLHRLFGRWEPLDRHFEGGALSRLSIDLAAAPDHAARVARVERFLLEHRGARQPDPLAVEAAQRLRSAGGALRVGDLARSLHVSIDALEKRFRRTIGAGPKQFAAMLRLRRALEAHQSGAELGRLALAAGYCDQSHFIRALRRATGQPPRAFLGRSDRC